MVDSTKPASRSTRRCLDTVGCGIRSWRSISPTDCCDKTSRLNIARRFGSAMISKTDSILLVYCTAHIRVKVYKGREPGRVPRAKILVFLNHAFIGRPHAHRGCQQRPSIRNKDLQLNSAL